MGSNYLEPRDAIILCIAFFLASILMPMGITEIFGTNVTGWGTAVTTVFQTLFPILGVVGLAMGFIPRSGKK